MKFNLVKKAIGAAVVTVMLFGLGPRSPAAGKPAGKNQN